MSTRLLCQICTNNGWLLALAGKPSSSAVVVNRWRALADMNCEPWIPQLGEWESGMEICIEWNFKIIANAMCYFIFDHSLRLIADCNQLRPLYWMLTVNRQCIQHSILHYTAAKVLPKYTYICIHVLSFMWTTKINIM